MEKVFLNCLIQGLIMHYKLFLLLVKVFNYSIHCISKFFLYPSDIVTFGPSPPHARHSFPVLR